MAKNERTGTKAGSLAGKALNDPKSVTPKQIRTIAASALTQRPDTGGGKRAGTGGGKAGKSR